MPDGFLLGVLFTVVVLALGLAVGATVGRYLWPQSDRTERDELEPVVSGLVQFTSQFSRDVSEYRTLIEAAALRARELEDAGSSPSTPGSGALLEQIIEANEHLRKRLNEAEESLQYKSEELQSYMTEARTDALTGLPNRRAFDDEMERRMAAFRRQGTPLGILLADVDRFKSINDQHGHPVGDQVLKAVADSLRTAVRDCDLIARYGGEEFVVLLAGNSSDEFLAAAERVRQAVEQREIRCQGIHLNATISCGVAEATSHEEVTGLLRRADEALYAAKSGGRNCAYWHDGRRTIRITLPSLDGISAAANTTPTPESFREVCAELRRKLMELTN